MNPICTLSKMSNEAFVKILIDSIISASSPTDRNAGNIVVEYNRDKAQLEVLRNDLINCKKFPKYVIEQLSCGLEIVRTSPLEAKINTYKLQYNSDKGAPIKPVWRK